MEALKNRLQAENVYLQEETKFKYCPLALALPEGSSTKRAVHRTEKKLLPSWFRNLKLRIRQKATVRKRAKLWSCFEDDYTTLRNRKPPVGRALTADEQQRLFEVARTKPAWLYAYVATFAFYCGLRACEIKGLRWQDIDFSNRILHIRRSKTPAEWRSPTLNATCLHVVTVLHDHAAKLGFTLPTHFVFPGTGGTEASIHQNQ